MDQGPAVLLRAIGLPRGGAGRGPADLAVLSGSALLVLGDRKSAASGLLSVMAGRSSTPSSRVLVGSRKLPVHTSEAAGYLGYVPSDTGCPDEVTPRAHLSLVASAIGLGGRKASRTISELLEWCLPRGRADSQWVELDEEERTATSLAAALLDNPQVLVADRVMPPGLLERLVELKALGKALVLRAVAADGIPPAADRIALCDAEGIATVVRRSDLEAVCRRMGTVEVGFYPSLPRSTMEELPGARDLQARGAGWVFGHADTASALVHLSGLARANARAIVSLRIYPPTPVALARRLVPVEDGESTLFGEGD